MTVKTYNPRIHVEIIKNIRRDDKGTRKRPIYVDLTPYLGDGSAVVTQKSIYAPMGAFSITIPDQAVGSEDFLDTVAAIADPMDHISIHMGREAITSKCRDLRTSSVQPANIAIFGPD